MTRLKSKFKVRRTKENTNWIVISDRFCITDSHTPEDSTEHADRGTLCWDENKLYIVYDENSWKYIPFVSFTDDCIPIRGINFYEGEVLNGTIEAIEGGLEITNLASSLIIGGETQIINGNIIMTDTYQLQNATLPSFKFNKASLIDLNTVECLSITEAEGGAVFDGSIVFQNGALCIAELNPDELLGLDSSNNISSVKNGMVPIGGVISWLKSYTNTPALPTNFVECNGQTLSDAESVYNGQTIPNLNGSSSTQRFLRGCTASGGTGGADCHNHTITVTTAGRACCTTPSTVTCVTTPTDSSSFLPSYYEVVWIIRVK